MSEFLDSRAIFSFTLANSASAKEKSTGLSSREITDLKITGGKLCSVLHEGGGFADADA